MLAGLVPLVTILGAAATPVHADTAGDLKVAKANLATIQSQLDALVASYDAAQARYATTQAQIQDVRARAARERARMSEIHDALAGEAWDAYESGGVNTVELLLTSSSFSEFSDRVEFLGSLARSDNDLLVQAGVSGEKLRRLNGQLSILSAQQSTTVGQLSTQKAAIASQFAAAQSQIASLQAKLAALEAAARAAQPGASGPPGPVTGGGPLQACPVGQPRAFSDDFGDPRPGGRTHQGIDLLAPLGAPIYAAQSGQFEQNSNSLGGTSALLYADNGDYTYYAHMSSYAGVANGAHVPAGTMIGHVGNTGDAAGGPYHLHFEYHPGGGGAVDPYRYLVAVCG
jgi:murein DD-endopeptidase MepM/ murein hydrolase activator NlpD